MTAQIQSLAGNCRLTRRKLLAAAGALFVCGPSIVRAASLMPVRSILMRVDRPYEGLVGRILLDQIADGLISGRVQGGQMDVLGRKMSEAEALRAMAYARHWGFLTAQRQAQLDDLPRIPPITSDSIRNPDGTGLENCPIHPNS